MTQIPVLDNAVNTRLEIIKTIYRLSGMQAKKRIRLDPAQIEGGYYSELKYELRLLKEKGLIDFTGNLISRKFQIALTDKGVQWIENAYQALSFEKSEKEMRLNELFSEIKI